jgi:hypothetical protein
LLVWGVVVWNTIGWDEVSADTAMDNVAAITAAAFRKEIIVPVEAIGNVKEAVQTWLIRSLASSHFLAFIV